MTTSQIPLKRKQRVYKTFGTELEYTNITREKAAKAIHSVVGGTVRYYGGV